MLGGRIGKKRSQGGKPVHCCAPALLAETFILQKHVQMPSEQAYHAGLDAPEIIGQGGALFQMIAAQGAKLGNAGGKTLSKRGMFRMEACQPLAQQALLARIVQKKKGRLPYVFELGTTGIAAVLRVRFQGMQAKGVAPGSVKRKTIAWGVAAGLACGKFLVNLQRKLGYRSGHEGLFAKKAAASALPAAHAAHGGAQYPLAGCRWACFAGVYRPHREIEHRYAKVIGKVHGAGVRRYAQVKRAHESRNFAQGKLAAQVCLRKAGTPRHFISKFQLGLAAQKNRGQIRRSKAHGKPCPEGCIRSFGCLTGAQNQPNAARSRWLGARMPHNGEVGSGGKIQQVQVGPVKGIGVVILRQGRAVQLPETLNAQSIPVGHRPKFEGGFKLRHELGSNRAAAQIDRRRVGMAGKLCAVRRGKKYGIRRQGHELLKKCRFSHHPQGIVGPELAQADKQWKGEYQVTHAVQLQHQNRVSSHYQPRTA